MTLYLSIAAIIFAFVSAVFWFLSSRVNFRFGFDMDKELSNAMKRASKLNAWAAVFTALAVISQALSMIIDICNKM
ncbi:hypothetical protein AGRI_01820 [Alishewanella agri BL06]|uniref:Uncharacterized protein n=1 Tax=Alishewanella agri BL06 TaxID=1195246 RepID=I9P6A7_9ALTE|nr:hypothetical protein [Alishewanella agri]EIW90567.1 hypothetical protein AGRI_01820 [Alishewanella agri BL06]